MRASRNLLLKCFLALMPCCSYAAAIPQLTLQNAVLLALRYNPAVKNAAIQRIVDRFNLRLAQNAYEVNYALTGSALYTNAKQNGTTSNGYAVTLTPALSLNKTTYGTNFTLSAPHSLNYSGGTNHFNPAINFQVTQPLLRGFGKTVSLLALYNAEDTAILNQLKQKATIVTTITQVINQFTALVQAENSVTIQQNALASSLATQRQYRALIAAGRNAPSDLVQFETDVANQNLALAQQKINAQAAYLALLASLGLDPTTQLTIVSAARMPPLPLPALTASIALALQNNIDYQTQLINLRILQRNVVAAKDQQRWQLDLVGTLSVGNTAAVGGAPLATQNRQLGLQLAIPIDDLNRKSLLVNANNSLAQARITLAATRRQVISAVMTAYHNLQSEQQQIGQAATAAQLAAENLQIAQLKAKYGRISSFEVSSLQTALLAAQLIAADAKENYFNACATFDQLVGLTLQRWQIQLRN